MNFYKHLLQNNAIHQMAFIENREHRNFHVIKTSTNVPLQWLLSFTTAIAACTPPPQCNKQKNTSGA
jgi:hypothetical protein